MADKSTLYRNKRDPNGPRFLVESVEEAFDFGPSRGGRDARVHLARQDGQASAGLPQKVFQADFEEVPA